MAQDRVNYRFAIKEVGGRVAKAYRIKRLVPLFEQGKIWLPEARHVANREGRSENLVEVFIEQEYAAFPVGLHNDMLDALSRIADPELRLAWPPELRLAWPEEEKPVTYRGWKPLDPEIGY